jgi:hypothetical protein
MAGREGTAPPPGDPNSPVLLLHQRPALNIFEIQSPAANPTLNCFFIDYPQLENQLLLSSKNP